MSDDAIIQVEGLGKRYSLSHLRDQRYVALRDVLVEKATGLFRRSPKGRSKIASGSEKPTARRADRRSGNGSGSPDNGQQITDNRAAPREDFWALRNVSFEVRRGEVVGIIGRNGAGKSTLLKILSRITDPTEGKVTLKGRVASLLEVGTGFHPELTGRENIYLNGAILGMHRAEIKAKFDEIVSFAEVEKFLDTPVKRYSSGMYVRLAFAVAAHLEPEILVIDEVLAVGDAEFQKKCLGKMGEVARSGRTVLFVSHNMVAVQNLCGIAIWLDGGSLIKRGDPGSIVHAYANEAARSLVEQRWDDISRAPGNAEFRLTAVNVGSAGERVGDAISISKPLEVEFTYWNLKPSALLNLSVYLTNEYGIDVLNTVPFTDPKWHGKPLPVGKFRSRFIIPAHLLNDGTYRVTVLAVQDESFVSCVMRDIAIFNVVDDQPRRGWQGKWGGVVRPRLTWTTEFIGA